MLEVVVSWKFILIEEFAVVLDDISCKFNGLCSDADFVVGIFQKNPQFVSQWHEFRLNEIGLLLVDCDIPDSCNKGALLHMNHMSYKLFHFIFYFC